MAVADRAEGVEEVAEEVEEGAGEDQEVLDEEVGFWRGEGEVGGEGNEVGGFERTGEGEVRHCWMVSFGVLFLVVSGRISCIGCSLGFEAREGMYLLTTRLAERCKSPAASRK